MSKTITHQKPRLQKTQSITVQETFAPTKEENKYQARAGDMGI